VKLGQVFSARGAAILGATLVAAAVFAHTLEFKLTNWDDPEYVVANPVLVSGKLLRILDPDTTVADAWTPLTTASYAIERSIAGLEPAIYHATNVLLHALCSGAVAWLLLGTGLSPVGAFLGAALFAVHPLQVESVAWVSSRKNLLSTLLLLLALGAFRRGDLRGAGVGTVWGTLSLLAKPTAVVAAPLALLDRLRISPRGLVPALRHTAPLALVALALGLLAVHHQEAVRAELAAVPLVGRIVTMGSVVLASARLGVLPTELSAHYPIVPSPASDPAALVITVVLGALFVGAAWLLRRDRTALFFLCWIPVAAFPHSNLIAGPFWMADRYAYLPLVGVAGLTGVAWDRLISGHPLRRRIFAAAGATALVALASVSIDRARTWRTSSTLWEDTLQKAPLFAEGYLNLGYAYVQEKRHAEAAEQYRRALELRPGYEDALTSLANELDLLGRREEAMRLYRRALELDPESGVAHYNLALVLQHDGRLEEARAHYVRAVDLEPGNWLYWNNLGTTFRALGQEEEALEAYRRALDTNPGYAPAWANWADTLRRAGRLDEAARAYERAIAADPHSAHAKYGLAALHAARGELILARDLLREVLELEPDADVARRSLSQVESRLAGSASPP
jgi:tetratricopeptide (TPR) repeat protein